MTCTPKTDAAREAKWEAESDARALRDATAVRACPKRLKAAVVELKNMEAETKKTLRETRAARGLKRAFPDEHNSSHKGGY